MIQRILSVLFLGAAFPIMLIAADDKPAPKEDVVATKLLSDAIAARAVWKDFPGFTAHIRCRGEEAKKLKHEAGFRARRWVVERTHSWLNRFRGILTRWEKRADTYLAMLHLACGLISWRAANWEPLPE